MTEDTMFKTRIITAKTAEGLEKEMNTFLDELTNVTIIQIAYQHYQQDGELYLTALVVYQINHDTTQFGAA